MRLFPRNKAINGKILQRILSTSILIAVLGTMPLLSGCGYLHKDRSAWLDTAYVGTAYNVAGPLVK